MSLFSTLYRQVDLKKNDRRNYLMGSLFVIASLLKIEAKSYLNTCKKNNSEFKEVCELVDQENPVDKAGEQYMRELKAHDKAFFEQDFCEQVISFIKAISSNLKGVMNDKNYDLMLDLTNENFYDDMKDLEDDEPTRLDQVLASHFVTKFILDVLQFCYAYLVRAKTAASLNPPDKKQFYDHRTPIILEQDCQ